MIIGAVASVTILTIELIVIHTVNKPKEENEIKWHLKHGYADYLD
jgi:hypothetical protein